MMGIFKKKNTKANSAGGIWGKLILCTAPEDEDGPHIVSPWTLCLCPAYQELRFKNDKQEFKIQFQFSVKLTSETSQ